MSEPSQIKEPLEHRAAGWLNRAMYYGLVSIAMLTGLWVLVSSIIEASAIVETLPSAQQQVFQRAFAAFCFVMSGSAMALNWRRRNRPTSDA